VGREEYGEVGEGGGCGGGGLKVSGGVGERCWMNDG